METIRTNIHGFEITISENNIHIQDSYKVNSTSAKEQILNCLREYMEDYVKDMDSPLNYRSNKSLIREWITHNNLYKLNLYRDRTASVDLDYPQKWYRKIAYFIFSIISL